MSTTAGAAMQAPNGRNWLGTDLLGRDVFSRVLFGGQRTLWVAALATGIAVLPGLIIGLVAGSLGAIVDRIIMIVINSLLAIPPFVSALVILTLLGQGTGQLALATGGAQIAVFAQVTRSATVSVRSEEYIEAARALGGTRFHSIRFHILPNIRPTIYGYAGVIFAYSILNSAALSFLGLGGDPGVPDWGAILADGRMAFQIAPWVAIAPGLLIMITVMAVNALADHLASRQDRAAAQSRIWGNLRQLIRKIHHGGDSKPSMRGL